MPSKPLKLVKCSIMLQEPRLKKTLKTNEICGRVAPEGILQKVVRSTKPLVHTSFVTENYKDMSFVTKYCYGFIFETRAKPHCVIPFDLDFLDLLESDSFEMPDSSVKKIIREFRFDSIDSMLAKYPKPGDAKAKLARMVKSGEIGSHDIDSALDDYNTDYAKFSHNEIIFENKIKIKPLAFFGSKTPGILELYNIRTKLKVYPTALEGLKSV